MTRLHQLSSNGISVVACGGKCSPPFIVEVACRQGTIRLKTTRPTCERTRFDFVVLTTGKHTVDRPDEGPNFIALDLGWCACQLGPPLVTAAACRESSFSLNSRRGCAHASGNGVTLLADRPAGQGL